MSDQDFKDFLATLDAVCAIALASGMSNQAIAGALLARCQQLYLADGQADLQGLSDLLTAAQSWIDQRPRWDLE
jgi:hypothetical protein